MKQGIRIFHGGCHSCISQTLHGIERCEGCQYYEPNWDKPNLYLAKPKNLLDIMDESRERFNKSQDKYSQIAEKIYRSDNGNYVVRHNNGTIEQYRGTSMADLHRIIEKVWSPREPKREIIQQFSAGYPIPLEFLEAFGEDYKEEIERHPKYDELVLPIIAENGLDHLLPERVKDIFIF